MIEVTQPFHFRYLRSVGSRPEDLSAEREAQFVERGWATYVEAPAPPPAPVSIPHADRMVRTTDRPVRTRGKKAR